MEQEYTIRAMTGAEAGEAVGWAAAEGWNPGGQDASCFTSVDPEGFIGGFLGDRMIASISVVNYDPSFAFLGFYIVHPDFRGKGYGFTLWKAGMAHAGSRTIGLDGVVAEQENYKRSGFDFAYRNIRFGGVPKALTVEDAAFLKPLTALSDELVAYDRKLFPAPRDRFLDAWLATSDHTGFAAMRDGALVGYAVVRPCRAGSKIGPLFADDAAVARQLAKAAVDAAGGGEIFLDAPEPIEQAVALARELGLEPVFETARMYRGTAPDIDLGRVFGVTTFELG
ncbi:GNAT family N-acetyltransferase [Nisaea nitritireducens]|uniref:GNAT family N-acetyltransferase n=1 Tax=Nisaea nitritireducens TaxID=568392 RepID=UPI0018662037|nr:GNAT family N-acetyltransferase [Nisaea nitritireducens]